MIRHQSTQIRLITAVLGFALVSQVASAGKVAGWRHDSRSDFEKGVVESLVVGGQGELGLGHELTEIADLGCASVWDLIRTENGRLLAATAMPGKVVAIDPLGKTSTLWEDDDAQAFALAARGDGSVLVGTGPEGRIFLISPDGEASELCQIDGLYVWDLVADSDGNVLAATGPNGKIFRIGADGDVELFFETGGQHVLALARMDDGTLIAGTDGEGLVWSIDTQGQGRVLYDTAEGEVRALRVDPQGTIYAATARPGKSSSRRTSTSSLSSSSTGSSKSKSTKGSSTTSANSSDNAIYRIDRSGGVKRVFSKKALIYGLHRLGRSGSGRLLVGTGNEGQLYVLDDNADDVRQLARLDVDVILSLVEGAEGMLLLGTGNPGKLYSLTPDYKATGTLVSAPLDAKLIARFGAINWRADKPPGTQVSLATRSGNTQTPDETWSAWTVEQTDAEHSSSQSPPARFLQYRVTLSTTDPLVTPVVRSLTARYLTANQPPSISGLTVPHVDQGDGKKRVEKLKLKWTAKDPNDDDLEFEIRFRKPAWNTWVTLKESLTSSEYEWDVQSVPEGVYQIRVTATDRPSNPADDALSAVVESEPFVVDRAGPAVEAKLTGVDQSRTATIDVDLEDALSPLVAASYSLDSDDWVNLFPRDDLFDSVRERLRFDVSRLKPGIHVVVVRATDAAGHVGSADVVFQVEEMQQAADDARPLRAD